jgi:uncharacterized protein (DUF488 family)
VIFSVGHSRHDPATFAHIIEGIDTLIDVRSHPTSRMEWWRLAAMQEWLPAYGIDVAWMPELGGWDRRHLAYAEPLAAARCPREPRQSGKTSVSTTTPGT